MFCAVVLIMVMLPIQAYAADYEFLTEVKSNVNQLLGVAAMQKGLYGLNDVDFSDLHLGTEIPLYKVEVNGLAKVANIHYFPIVSDGEWVATATVTYNTLGEMSVELSKIYVDEYKTIDSDGKIALVFDGEETYLYVDDDCVSSQLEGEIDIALSLNTVSIEGQTETLQVQAVSSSDVVSLGVPQIQQSYENTCWAACTASIINYYGGNVTEGQLIGIVGSTNNQSMGTVENLLESYGLDWGRNGTLGLSYTNSLVMSSIVTEIGVNQSPMYAVFTVKDTSISHAVVIQGYVNTSSIQTVSYMNPASGYYAVSTVPSSGKISYASGNYTYEYNAGIAVYD